VFAAAELPEGSSPEQVQRFQAGQGGALTPLMCVDKTPDEIASFDALVQESQQFGQVWTLVFVRVCQAGDGCAPAARTPTPRLQRMVAAIKAGTLGQFIPFNPQGEPMALH